MTAEKFGRTLLFVFFLMVFLKGVQLASLVTIPYIRRVSPGLADLMTFLAS